MTNNAKTILKSIDTSDVIDAALKAGEAVMEIYEKDFDVTYKEDSSPLTEADRIAHRIICGHLSNIQNQKDGKPFPLLSEEGRDIPYEERSRWTTYWCIDPIDGTKEFIKKNGEFTINIALIHHREPVLGVVYVPAMGELYFAKKGEGAYKITCEKDDKKLDFTRKQPLPLKRFEKRETFVIVASKSHLNDETKNLIETLTKQESRKTVLLSRGSSLKLLMIAEGTADIYPRLAPTMEWDTAAADAIVRESGKMVYQFDKEILDSLDHNEPVLDAFNKEPFVYNKTNLLNPWFVTL